jgi:hypothetical protein
MLVENYFRKLETDTFEGLANVTRIHMFENRLLSQIAPDLFKNMPKLKKIDMRDSDLKSIDLNMFKCVPSLECLIISNKNPSLKRDFIESLNESKKYSFTIF